MSMVPTIDKTAYLANVVAIAGANGLVTPAEQRVYQAVAARIGADSAQMAEARQRADAKDFRLVVLSDLPSRLANLEDMLMMSLADGQLDEKESAPLEKLATDLKFTQMDVDMALRRAQSKLAKLTAGRPASTATAADAPARGAMAPRTVAASQTASQPSSSRTRQTVRRTTPRKRVEHVLAPMLTAPWQKKKVTVVPAAGASAAPESDVTAADRVTAEAPQSLRDACMRQRADSADPEAYCHGLHTGDPNVWGCRLAEMPLITGADWLACGRFRDDRTFVFDREAIAKMLEERLAIAAGCPHLRLDRLDQALAAFPTKAVQGPRWTYRRAATPDSGTTVVLREYIHGCPLTQRFRAECMDPVGDGALRRILRDAARG